MSLAISAESRGESGRGERYPFETPLMWIDKAETRALADYWANGF